MPKSREPVYGKGHLHLITCNCYPKQPKLELEKHRNVFVRLLEEIRVKFRFSVAGYVVMPDHFRLLMVEPAVDTAANSIDMLQQRYQRRYNTSARSTEQVWEVPLLRRSCLRVTENCRAAGGNAPGTGESGAGRQRYRMGVEQRPLLCGLAGRSSNGRTGRRGVKCYFAR